MFTAIFTGRVVSAPERIDQFGKPAYQFRVEARQGSKEPRRIINVITAGRSAEYAVKCVSPGVMVVCHGRLRTPWVELGGTGPDGCIHEELVAVLVEQWNTDRRDA